MKPGIGEAGQGKGGKETGRKGGRMTRFVLKRAARSQLLRLFNDGFDHSALLS